MDFSSAIFWLISLPAIALIFFINKSFPRNCDTFNKYALCLLSLFLLYQASVQTLIIFLFVTLLVYVSCRIGQDWDKTSKKILLCILIPLQLLPLMFYKYADFIFCGVLRQNWDTFRDLVIPIGISFYTFQTIAFCLDTLSLNQKVPAFIDYMNFCSFFPQIVAGPIERRDSLLPQMEKLKLQWNSSSVAEGLPYIILGIFFKMVMADNLARGMIPHYEGTEAFQIWANNISFGFRIYFDFAGYGMTAYGIAKALGIKITLNFQSPYTCCDISNFWRNWHISLTQWFRDYIYFTLGGNRTNLWWFNIVFMFFVSGIWHGAGWNFIIWGTLSGIAMVIHRHFKKSTTTLPPFLCWFLTFSTMTFIWMFFYETDMKVVAKNLGCILNPSDYSIQGYINLLQNSVISGSHFLIFAPLSFFIIALEHLSRKKYQDPYKIFLNPRACMIMIACIFILYSPEHSQFIYFAF